MKEILHLLEMEETPHFLAGFSALDRYFDLPDAGFLRIDTEASLVDLAKTIPGLSYPGIEDADAAVRTADGLVLLRSIDSVRTPPRRSFSVLDLLYDPVRRVFLDPYGVYYELRGTDLGEPTGTPGSWLPVRDAAILVSRYHYTAPDLPLAPASRTAAPRVDEQRDLLSAVLTSRKPWKGLRLLRREGYLERFQPELERMDMVSHAKEYHPEGNVWEHTLETFRYRKTTDLVLSLALLFHDSGKAVAQPYEGNRFDRHAEIGVRIAGDLLHRLGFPEEVTAQVGFLIRYHMIPGALAELPTSRVEPVMSSPLFPVLLELYRCDLSSTWRGPDGYYAACQIYKTYLRNTRNPFRTAAGKKLLRLYVE